MLFFKDRSQSHADRQARPVGYGPRKEDPTNVAARPHDVRGSPAAVARGSLRGHGTRRSLQGQLSRHIDNEGLPQLLVRGVEVHVVGPQAIQRKHDGHYER